jgi:hypothetical protein
MEAIIMPPNLMIKRYSNPRKSSNSHFGKNPVIPGMDAGIQCHGR